MPDGSTIDVALRAHGLMLIGGFVPDKQDGIEAAQVLVIGSLGRAIWPHLAASPELADGLGDPLDRLTRRTVDDLADQIGARACYPFDGPPYLPFQRWALRADSRFHPSPLGLLIHPAHGLWAGLRAALLLDMPVTLAEVPAAPSPCLTCDAKPCLATCPVGAFDGTGYAVGRCAAHLRQPAGERCMSGGCLARRACPVGREHAPEPEMAAFHMQAFLGSR